jgi:hypothetical protein
MEAGEPVERYSPSGEDCGIGGRYNSVWFRVTIPSSWHAYNDLYFSTAAPDYASPGSQFDTVLALYRGTSLGTLQQVACSNDNSGLNWTDWMEVRASPGATYYLQLTGTGGAPSGKYVLRLAQCGYNICLEN